MKSVFIFSALWGLTASLVAQSGLPLTYLEKLKVIPDLPQTDNTLKIIPDRGNYHCGPTAAVNALVGLDQSGFDNLVPFDAGSRSDTCNLITILGGDDYCRTKPKKGTGPIGLMTGIGKYVRERGYRAILTWRGRRDGGAYEVGALEDVRFFQEGISGNRAMILNIGWYRTDPDGKTIERIGGHYVTLAGYDFSDAGHLLLLIHDPAARSGKEPRHEKCHLIRWETKNLPAIKKEVRNFGSVCFELRGIALKKGADRALIDGAAQLECFSK